MARQIETEEKDVVRAVEEALTWDGWFVARTNRGGKATRRLKAGTPDLFATKPPMRCWIGIEVKRPGGRVRERQAELQRQESIIIVDDAADALWAARVEWRRHSG